MIKRNHSEIQVANVCLHKHYANITIKYFTSTFYFNEVFYKFIEAVILINYVLVDQRSYDSLSYTPRSPQEKEPWNKIQSLIDLL